MMQGGTAGLFATGRPAEGAGASGLEKNPSIKRIKILKDDDRLICIKKTI